MVCLTRTHTPHLQGSAVPKQGRTTAVVFIVAVVAAVIAVVVVAVVVAVIDVEQATSNKL